MDESAEPSISCLSACQAPIQGCIRPGAWIPGYRNIRYYAETWNVQATPDAAFEAFLKAISEFKKSEKGVLGGLDKLRIQRQDKKHHKATVFCFTKVAEWLDVVEISITDGSGWENVTEDLKEGCVVIIRSFSSGFFPTSCPLSPLFSCLCFLMPFGGSYQGPEGTVWTNNSRIKEIRNVMQDKMPIVVTGKTEGCSAL
ncbi:hypothetical protein AAMO2058_000614000 [Amorphochlora amoebiformis]|uniref:Uncharacterized protein n=2 Tax=Amorphochlora amoebiformis TaxID=1561963 RepID=A0A7S0DL16_9EUKA|mmetsp:Transcript_2924/g.4459  ORF Transcript_2924/g.4459 Transcript_2924/m.4459 type:complete len:199 (+) Transcript_2924:1-597(+)